MQRKNEACDRESEKARDREQANTNTRAHATKKMMPNDINQFVPYRAQWATVLWWIVSYRKQAYTRTAKYERNDAERCVNFGYMMSLLHNGTCLMTGISFSGIYCAVYWTIYLFHVCWVVIAHAHRHILKKNAMASTVIVLLVFDLVTRNESIWLPFRIGRTLPCSFAIYAKLLVFSAQLHRIFYSSQIQFGEQPECPIHFTCMQIRRNHLPPAKPEIVNSRGFARLFNAILYTSPYLYNVDFDVDFRAVCSIYLLSFSDSNQLHEDNRVGMPWLICFSFFQERNKHLADAKRSYVCMSLWLCHIYI